MSSLVPLDEIQYGVSQLVGMERAKQIVAAAVTAEGLELKPGYSTQEIRQICENLKESGGMIAVVVSAIAVRLIMSQHNGTGSGNGNGKPVDLKP